MANLAEATDLPEDFNQEYYNRLRIRRMLARRESVRFFEIQNVKRPRWWEFWRWRRWHDLERQLWRDLELSTRGELRQGLDEG